MPTCFSHVRLFCNPMDCNLPGFSVHGILQARVLEGVAMSSSRIRSLSRDQTTKPVSPALVGKFFIPSTTWEAL